MFRSCAGIARRALLQGSADPALSLDRFDRERLAADLVSVCKGATTASRSAHGFAFRLSAGRFERTVFVNGELTEGSGAFARVEAGSSIGRGFRRFWLCIDQPTKSSAVQYVVLSDPEVDGARIMVVRTDGEPHVYSGHLT